MGNQAYALGSCVRTLVPLVVSEAADLESAELMHVPAGVCFNIVARGPTAASGGSGLRLFVKCMDLQMSVQGWISCKATNGNVLIETVQDPSATTQPLATPRSAPGPAPAPPPVAPAPCPGMGMGLVGQGNQMGYQANQMGMAPAPCPGMGMGPAGQGNQMGYQANQMGMAPWTPRNGPMPGPGPCGALPAGWQPPCGGCGGPPPFSGPPDFGNMQPFNGQPDYRQRTGSAEY